MYYSKWFRFLTFMFRSLIHNDLVFLHLSWSKALISLFCRCMLSCLCTTFYRVMPFHWSLSLSLSEPFHCIYRGLSVRSLFYSIVLCSYPFAWTILVWVLQICALCNHDLWVQSCCPVFFFFFVILLWLLGSLEIS